MDEMTNTTIEDGQEAQTPNEYEGVAPHENMIFSSLDKGIKFYELYAKSQGFDYVKRTKKCFSRSTEARYMVLCCNRYGIYSKKKSTETGIARENTQTVKCGCVASFTIARKTPKDPWVSANVRNDHNHALASPRSRRNLKINKHMPDVAKNLVEHFSEAGLPTGKVPEELEELKKVEDETSEDMLVEVAQVGSRQSDSERPIIGNLEVAITKGRPKGKKQTSANGREKSGLEIAMEASKKRKRKCTNCKEEGHTRAKCPDLLKVVGEEIGVQKLGLNFDLNV